MERCRRLACLWRHSTVLAVPACSRSLTHRTAAIGWSVSMRSWQNSMAIQRMPTLVMHLESNPLVEPMAFHQPVQTWSHVHQQARPQLCQQTRNQVHQQPRPQLYQHARNQVHQQPRPQLYQQTRNQVHQQPRPQLYQQARNQVHQQSRPQLHQQTRVPVHQQVKAQLDLHRRLLKHRVKNGNLQRINHRLFIVTSPKRRRMMVIPFGKFNKGVKGAVSVSVIVLPCIHRLLAPLNKGLLIWVRLTRLALSSVHTVWEIKIKDGATWTYFDCACGRSFVNLRNCTATVNAILLKWKIRQISQNTATKAAKRPFSHAQLKRFHPG